VRGPASTETAQEKSLKKEKVFLDKRLRLCYYIQADADEAAAECTLKIEQCKKKLMLNKHQRRVL
jgi:hypothetical protein